MNEKMKNKEIPEKINSKNIFLLQDFIKELENEYFITETNDISLRFLVKAIFSLLNSQITLLFQLSKLNLSINSHNSNDLVEHIFSFNKNIMSRQIQKIISFTNICSNSSKTPLANKKTDMRNKKPKNKSINKRELNKSYLTNTSLINLNKYKNRIKNDRNMNTDSSYDLASNCITQPNDNKENEKNETLFSLRDKNNKNAATQKIIKTINNTSQLNTRLISFIKNKNKNKESTKKNKKKLNKLIKNDLTLSLLEQNEKIIGDN